MPRHAALLILALSTALSSATIEQVARDATLVEPFGVTFDRAGNWYICEHKGEKISRVDPTGKIIVVAGTGKPGYGGDGGPAVDALLFDPHGIEIAPDGRMYIADTLNHRIRRLDLATGRIETIAGTGEPGFSGDGGPAANAAFHGTFAIALDRAGANLYVADLNNRRVRRIDLKSGAITTVAGNGQAGIPADGALAVESPLVDPRAIAVDSKGNLYILERRGNALRVVDRKGRIQTLVGPDTVNPPLNGPKHLSVDAKDRVLIADAENHLIRLYDPVSRKLTTIAGTGVKGDRIVADDPLRTELNRPHGIIADRAGNLYISDSYNHRVLKMRP